VQFNPSSLQFTVANSLDPNKKNKGGVQFVSQSTAKLTMDLIFDTTHTGLDVRISTDQIAKLYFPYEKQDQDGDDGSGFPPLVEFGWGAYKFKGIVEQYTETLDFFSSEGVPLRASINLTLSENKFVFKSSKNPDADADRKKGPGPVVVPDDVGQAAVANALGDPRAARAIASFSGSVSLRFGGGASLAVSGDASLSPPAAFSAGGGLGFSGGAGAGAGLSVTETAGASFTGLRVGGSATAGTGTTDTRALLPPASVASGSGTAGFDLGGAARASGGGSLNADVGASADLSARIGFSD